MRRRELRDFWLTLWNQLYFDLASGPAYFLWRGTRPSVWERIVGGLG